LLADTWNVSTLARRCTAWLLIGLGAVWVAWLGGHFESLGDYGSEFAPAMSALLAGHVHAFSHLLPEDGAGGSVLLRAPGALAGKLLVGGQLAMFRFGTLACELAAGALGLVLARDMRARGLPLVSRVATIGLCVLAGAVLDAIFFAHPEEVLGATLCVAAVLLNGANRPTLAGVALGCALINKPWGAFAIAPVLLAGQSGLRRVGVGTLAVVVPWLALAYHLDPARVLHAMTTASSLAIVAHPVAVWWPLDHLVRQPGITPFYAPPRLLADHAREVAVVLAIPLSLPLALSRLTGLRPAASIPQRLARLRPIAVGERAGTDAALALLALMFLLRCMLDPSNHIYYQVPFILALLAWESRIGRGPVRSLLAVGLLWLVFHTISGVGSLTVQYAAYMLVTVPFVIALLGPATAGTLRWPAISPWHPGANEAWQRAAIRESSTAAPKYSQ
jgi:hypothetical protein